jgi:hypothetical protein
MSLLNDRLDYLINIVFRVFSQSDIREMIKQPRKKITDEQLIPIDIYFLFENLYRKYSEINGNNVLMNRGDFIIYLLKILIQNNYLTYDGNSIEPNYGKSFMKEIYDDFEKRDNKKFNDFILDLEKKIFGKEYQSKGWISDYLLKASSIRDMISGTPKYKNVKVKSQIQFIDYVGPYDNPNKYGLTKKIGQGVYGTTYIAINLDKQQGEQDQYLIKILNQNSNASSWLKEVNCLLDVIDVCKKGGILCYQDSFIIQNGNQIKYVIVVPYLDGYVTLRSMLEDYDKKGKRLSLSDAQLIYQQVIEIKNELNDLCINHSDLHSENIMIDPITMKTQIIDLGRCQTPQEEYDEWFGFYKDATVPRFEPLTYQEQYQNWNNYSDEGRIFQLKRELFLSVYGYYPVTNADLALFNKPIVNPPIQGCKRNTKYRNLISSKDKQIANQLYQKESNEINKYKQKRMEQIKLYLQQNPKYKPIWIYEKRVPSNI